MMGLTMSDLRFVLGYRKVHGTVVKNGTNYYVSDEEAGSAIRFLGSDTLVGKEISLPVFNGIDTVVPELQPGVTVYNKYITEKDCDLFGDSDKFKQVLTECRDKKKQQVTVFSAFTICLAIVFAIIIQFHAAMPIALSVAAVMLVCVSIDAYLTLQLVSGRVYDGFGSWVDYVDGATNLYPGHKFEKLRYVE